MKNEPIQGKDLFDRKDIHIGFWSYLLILYHGCFAVGSVHEVTGA